MKKYFIIASLFFGLLFIAACSDNAAEKVEQEEDSILDERAPDASEEVVEPEISLGDHIKGTWEKIAQSCDSEGNNCDETKGTDWVFDGEQVTLGRISQPYHVSNDTIYIVDSPYEISKEWGDTILLHGIKMDRYMKLVRK